MGAIMEDIFTSVKVLVCQLRDGGNSNQNTVRELATRFESLSENFEYLMKLNSQYIESDHLRTEINKLFSSIIIPRKYPDVPVKIEATSYEGFFVPGREKDDEKIRSLKNEIAQKLENFYYNADKIWSLVEVSLLKKRKRNSSALQWSETSS